MKVRLTTSGGFAGIEQVYETQSAQEEVSSTVTGLVGMLDGSSANVVDGMTYQLEVDQGDGWEMYCFTDAASAAVLDLTDTLIELLSSE